MEATKHDPSRTRPINTRGISRRDWATLSLCALGGAIIGSRPSKEEGRAHMLEDWSKSESSKRVVREMILAEESSEACLRCEKTPIGFCVYHFLLDGERFFEHEFDSQGRYLDTTIVTRGAVNSLTDALRLDDQPTLWMYSLGQLKEEEIDLLFKMINSKDAEHYTELPKQIHARLP